MFSSNLTYRQGRILFSELDSYGVSSSNIEHMCSLYANQDITLHSHHAPLSIVVQAPDVNLDSRRSVMMLGNRATFHNRQSSNLLRKSVRFSVVDADQFVHALLQHDLMSVLVAEGLPVVSLKVDAVEW